MNEVFFSGVISGDAEIKVTPSGKSVARFQLGIPDRKKDANGNWSTNWNNASCEFWCDRPEKLDALKKGVAVIISARFQVDKWMDKEGKQAYKQKFVVNSLDFLQKREKAAPQSFEPSQPQTQHEGGFDADISF